MNEFNDIKDLIAKGRTERAIELLINLLSTEEFKNEELLAQVRTLSAKLTELRSSENMGLIPFGEASTQRAQINYGILKLLDLAGKKSEAPRDDLEASPTPKPPISEIVKGLKEKGIPPAIDRKIILFLASNPSDSAKLQLEQEFKSIYALLQDYYEQYHVVTEWAIKPDDLQRAILKYKPAIIHFSGHGEKEDKSLVEISGELGLDLGDGAGLILLDSEGKSKLVQTKALSNLFKIFTMDDSFNIETVVLNACHSAKQAEAISEHVKYAIGMNNPLTDNSALEFSIGFYRALADGRNVNIAYELAKNKIELEGYEESHIPILYQKK